MLNAESMNTLKKSAGSQTQRTRIEELSPVGYQLSEEDLRFVTGGFQFLMNLGAGGAGAAEGSGGSAGTCSPTAQCDDD